MVATVSLTASRVMASPRATGNRPMGSPVTDSRLSLTVSSPRVTANSRRAMASRPSLMANNLKAMVSRATDSKDTAATTAS